MNSTTTFRKTLAGQLAAIGYSRELDENLIQMQHVEEKQGVLGELLDYYTEDLMKYKPFADEFDSTEIDELHRLLNLLPSAIRTKGDWSKVQTQAKDFLARLQSRGI